MSAVFKKCLSPLIFVMTLNTISDWRKNFRGNFVKIKFWDENVHVWCFSKNYLAKKNNKKLECLFSEFSLNPILSVVFGPAFRVGVCKSASTNLTYDWEKLESRNSVIMYTLLCMLSKYTKRCLLIWAFFWWRPLPDVVVKLNIS